MKIGDTVISTRSWTKFKIAKIDYKNQMVIDKNDRAISFSEIN